MNHHVRIALLYALWHHQGGRSPEGQALRQLLGMGPFDRLSDAEVRQVQAVDSFLNHERDETLGIIAEDRMELEHFKRRALEAEADVQELLKRVEALNVLAEIQRVEITDEERKALHKATQYPTLIKLPIVTMTRE